MRFLSSVLRTDSGTMVSPLSIALALSIGGLSAFAEGANMPAGLPLRPLSKLVYFCKVVIGTALRKRPNGLTCDWQMGPRPKGLIVSAGIARSPMA
jgi:hypothetical protein